MVDRAKKLTELATATSVVNNDIIVIVANTSGTATTKQITVNNFMKSAPYNVNTMTVSNLTVTSNLTVNNALSVSGDLTLYSNVYFGTTEDNASMLIHVHGTLHSNLIPHTPNNYQLGNTTNQWLRLCVGGLTLGDNTIAASNSGLAITANSAQVAFRGNAPATASSNGTLGDIAFDSNYLYYCVANNTWKRAALSTW